MRKHWLGSPQQHLVGFAPLSGNLRVVITSLEALLDNQVEMRVCPKGLLGWIAQGLLSVRVQESEFTKRFPSDSPLEVFQQGSP